MVCTGVSAQNARINYDESKVPQFELPALLTSDSGDSIRTVEEWETVRRPEILEMFRKEMFGRTPADRIAVKWDVISENGEALGGKATFRQVMFTFGEGENTLEAILLLILPNEAKGKVPVIISYNFNGNHSTCMEPDILYPTKFDLIAAEDSPLRERGNQISRWPLEMIVDRGYAVATMCYHDIFPDRADLRDRSAAALFPDFLNRMRDHDEWGAIGVWAWGYSRIADYLETVGAIDSNRMAVMGHSRQGKAAVWAGAQDERFKVVISNDSGCGGAALSKRVFGENISCITNTFPHWFCPGLCAYAGNEQAMPFDQHMLLAAIAPRHLYVASAVEDRWADPRGEYLGAYHAGEVYRLYGLKPLESMEMPPVHTPIHNDVAYHIRAGRHDVTEYDWKCYLDYCDIYMK